MKNLSTGGLWAGALLLLTGGAVHAGPLQRADVPGNPAWVLHLDFDGLRGTALGEYFLSEMDKPEPQARLAAFQTIFNFDLRTGMHGATLFSPTKDPHDGVLLVYASFDAGRLETLAKAAKEYSSTPYKQHVVHSWIDERRPARDGAKPRTYAAIFGNRVVIFGQRDASVKGALDVLDRNAPNLAATGEFSQLGRAQGASFVQAAARKMDMAASDPNAAVFRLSEEVRLEVAETARQVSVSLALQAGEEEAAKHINSIAQGLVALMKMQTDKPHNVKLAEATTITQSGQVVFATATLPADHLIALAKADAARKAAAKAGN